MSSIHLTEYRDEGRLQTPPDDSDSLRPPLSVSELEVARLREHSQDKSSIYQQNENLSPESEYLSGFRLWINLVAMMLSIFLIAMDMVGALLL